MPVHFAGLACDMGSLLEIVARHGLKVVEDAAHALPTTCDGKMVGTLGDLTVYSFYVTKTIATGEGGMVVTMRPEYAERLRTMRLHGISRDAFIERMAEKGIAAASISSRCTSSRTGAIAMVSSPAISRTPCASTSAR